MADPITLNVRDVALAARKAYDEKRLSAQGPTPECKYRDASGLPCAIGAALDDQTARAFDGNRDDFGNFVSSIGRLVGFGLVKTDDRETLLRLQVAHDDWADAPKHKRAHIEAEFLALLDKLTSGEG